MYIGEIATPKVRGFWGNFMSIFTAIGQFFINLIGIYCNTRLTSYICLVPSILFIITFPFVPESPYYLLMKGKEEAARRSLGRLLRKRDVAADFEQLKADVKRQMSETGTWRDLVCIAANRKALIAGVLMRCAQQFCATGALGSYTRYIFEESGGDAESSTLIYSGASVIMTVIAGFTIHHFGRKKSFVVSMFLCIACILALSIFYYIKELQPQVDISRWLWTPLLGVTAFTIFSSFGVLVIPTLMLGELFSASIKAKGLTVLLSVMGLTISLSNYIFYWLTVSYGMYCPFLVFSIISVFLTILCIYIIPETKGKTLEEIQQILSGNVRE
ncbi:unnamed protein product [Acanthoscelides obtectus]|nr:unnamed protein product [Acanthoscelides obtectus]CAK1650194.1 Facilitated trehalose transporter Tret1 [Acanthoscelides obtectus]